MPHRQPEIVGVLLAAGFSRRYGGDKLLATLPDGRPVAVAAARALNAGLKLEAGDSAHVLAVVRPEQHALAELLKQEGLQVLCTAQAERGMGASLAAAVAAKPKAGAWLVSLADMPYVRADTVAAVARAMIAGHPLTAPSFQGRRGHPVGFAQAFGMALRRLDGDEGARALLAAHPVTLLPCDDPGVLRDIDVPVDLLESRP